MRKISERALMAVIPLLSHKISEMTEALRTQKIHQLQASDEQLDAYCELQLNLEFYRNTLHELRQEYDEALREGLNLPSIEQLTCGPD